MTKTTIRDMQPSDIPYVQDLLTTIALFPPEMLPDFFAATSGQPGQLWLVGEADGQIQAMCFAQAEDLAQNVTNMRALGVRGAAHRQGWAARLVAALEARLSEEGMRMMVVETSSLPEYAPARAFYSASGYAEVARIPEFWAPGDAKVVFTKSLID
ncbi:N-acetyltransferase family protein [Primorskyibacter sp. S187A]|uniref:GNAT family N-acetyltransferase n=1 Tax=Primorskyibacter sp. S187A TaxID=3415130 RepID=UPI003C7EAEE7